MQNGVREHASHEQPSSSRSHNSRTGCVILPDIHVPPFDRLHRRQHLGDGRHKGSAVDLTRGSRNDHRQTKHHRDARERNPIVDERLTMLGAHTEREPCLEIGGRMQLDYLIVSYPATCRRVAFATRSLRESLSQSAALARANKSIKRAINAVQPVW
jgi:hypothetical protein